MTKKYTSLEHLIRQIVTEGGVGFGTKGGDKAKGTSGAFYNSYSSKHGGHSSAMARVAAKDAGKENIKIEEAEEDKSNQASIDRIQRAADAIRAMTKPTTPVKLPNVDEFDLDQLKTGMKKKSDVNEADMPRMPRVPPSEFPVRMPRVPDWSSDISAPVNTGSSPAPNVPNVSVKPKISAPAPSIKVSPDDRLAKPEPASNYLGKAISQTVKTIAPRLGLPLALVTPSDQLAGPEVDEPHHADDIAAKRLIFDPTPAMQQKYTNPKMPVKLPNVDEFDLDQLKTGMKKTVKEDGAVPNEGNATPTSKAYGSFDEDGKKKLKEEKIVVKPKPTEKVTEKPQGSKGKKPAGEEDIVYPDGSNKPNEKPTQEKPEGTEKPEEKPNEKPEEAKKSKLSKAAGAAGFAARLLGGSSGGSTDGVQDWQYLSPGSIGTSAGSKFPLRKTVKEEVEGTMLRRNIENVARPKSALSPFDRKSKLAKQAEIKTKIIDEEKKLGSVIRKAVAEKKTREEKESSISDGKTKVVDNVIFNPPLNKVNVNEGKKKAEYEDSDESVPKTNFPYYKSMQAPPGEPQGGYDKQKNDNLTDFGKAAGVAAGAAGAASGAVGAAKYAKDVLTKPVSTTRGEIGSAKFGGLLGAAIGAGQEYLNPTREKDDDDKSPVQWLDKKDEKGNNKQGVLSNIGQSTVAGAAGSTMPGMLLDPDLSIPYPNLNAKNWDEFKKEPLKSLTIQKGSLNDGEQEALNKLRAKAHKSGFTPPGFASKEHYDQYKKEHGPIGFSISKGEYVLPKNSPHPKDYSDSLSKGKQ